MPTFRAMIVSAGSPHRAGVAGMVHADADALAFAKSLSKIVPADRLTLCVGPDATTAVLQFRFQSFSKKLKPGDTAIVAIFGSSSVVDDELFVHAWDTLPDAVAETAIPLAAWLKKLVQSKCESVLGVLDLTHDIEIAPFPKLTAFVSTGPGEVSHSTGTPPRGVWAGLVQDAFTGRLPAALTDDGRLTAHSLEQFFRKEFKRKLRSAFGPSAVQQPYTLGDADIELARFDDSETQHFGKAEWARIRFEGVTRTKVKDLQGYRKTFQMPDRVTPRANQFFGRLASPELREQLDGHYQSIIDSFSYRRKDVSRSPIDDGFGTIRTPDFELSLHVELDPAEPGWLVWRVGLGQISDVSFVRGLAFQQTFGSAIDRLIFESDRPNDVADVIDRYDEKPIPGSRMTADPEMAWCEISLAGSSGSIRVESDRITIRGKLGGTADLLSALFRFFGSGPASGMTALATTASRK